VTTPLRILSLGGQGEIGRNMTLFEYDGELLVVDCGLMFPEHDMLGVDLVIPDITYVVERRDRLRGIIITHGHEDHLGALPYLLQELEAPVSIWASRLTAGLITVRLREFKLSHMAEIHVVAPGDVRAVGPFSVEFIHVAHSIPDALGLAIETPVGTVVHTGEYKLDLTPYRSRPTDLQRLAELGRRGVLLLMADSTNADRPGTTPSEQEVTHALDHIFARAEGRIIVSTFASNISRVAQVMETARRHGRRVAVIGRSMVENVNMAIELGYLEVERDELVRPHELDTLPPEEVCIICTGSQGEPTSALVRMARGEHRTVTIQPGDLVILSATTIPGNEELVHRTINSLFRLGATVLYPPLYPVHVSGHASQEELKLMLSLVRPRFFMPIQGEYRHLVLHARLAEQVGISPDHIIVVESGTPVALRPEEWWAEESVGGDYIYVDGLGVGDVGAVVLRDRHRLAQDGFIVAVIVVERETGRLLERPALLSRGFVYMAEAESLMEAAADVVARAVAEAGPLAVEAESVVRKRLEKFFHERTRRHPMILPLVIQV